MKTLIIPIVSILIAINTSAQVTKLVWADLGNLSETGGKIRTSDLDGTNMKILVDSLFAPSGIAIDNSAAQPVVYFAERGTGKIFRVNIDGTNKEEVITGIAEIFDIELDLNLRKIFWISDTYSRDAVSWANMDGLNSGIEDLYISTGTFWGYNGLALDQANQRLFWIRNDNGCEDKIFRMNYDKSDFQIIIEHPENGLLGPRDIDVFENKIYWTDCGLTKDIIYKANLDGSGIDTVIKEVDSWFFAIDSETNKIYWENNDSIGCSNLDGSDRVNIVDNKANFIHGIALAYNVIDTTSGTTNLITYNPVPQINHIYPNPAVGQIRIELSIQSSSKVDVELFNSLGMKEKDIYSGYLSQPETTISSDVSGLKAGIYFIQISSNNQKKTHLIIVGQ